MATWRRMRLGQFLSDLIGLLVELQATIELYPLYGGFPAAKTW